MVVHLLIRITATAELSSNLTIPSIKTSHSEMFHVNSTSGSRSARYREPEKHFFFFFFVKKIIQQIFYFPDSFVFKIQDLSWHSNISNGNYRKWLRVPNHLNQISWSRSLHSIRKYFHSLVGKYH